MTDATRQNGHRWLKTSEDGRFQYVLGLIHGLQYQTAGFEAVTKAESRASRASGMQVSQKYTPVKN